MEIKVLEKGKNKLVIEVKGEDSTLCNAIRKELWNDDKVKVAAYNLEHPSSDSPKIIIETNGKDPKEALLDAVKRLKKENDKFRNTFLKEIK
ncbi:DNA-directed RNA polymerase subunit L [Candidatus Woesearchaeota archaeon CG10_big_fil_rev_8_21_14_0_10_44_13]|nr:MAG: DNA-directed RNA polymerase subunit L [Candidatus Woesearchaeota archaeon CG10_big_fil_rev_8_21_14_0_10_44_13]